ncbi:hypothetical protein KKC97_00625 [bacterium]|nr:hypothetical protein [bacterium]MBU1636153.1 hypothetical protein [bacterium]
MELFWTSIAGILTLSVLSFLYADNPFYKAAEHIFIGIAAGYVFCAQFHNVFIPNLWTPLTQHGELIMLIPFALGSALFTRFFKGIGWISRWPMSVIIGTYAGLAVIGFASGDLVLQVQASLIPVFVPATIDAFTTNMTFVNFLNIFTNLLFTVGLITVLFYFFFSLEHKGGLKHVALAGTTLLMIGFGAGYGYTVMTRIALLFDRFYFLFVEWLKIA